jgi:hypothetical protein
MTSQFGILDALQREYADMASEATRFNELAHEIIDADQQVMRQMRTEQAFHDSFASWLEAAYGRVASSLPPIERSQLERHYCRYLLDNMKTLPFLQAKDHLRTQLQDDMSALLRRIHAASIPRESRDVLQRNVLNLSSNLHTVMIDLNEVMNFVNRARGVHIIDRCELLEDDDTVDEVFDFMPSDFGVPMFSQRVCVMDEIVLLQPQLEYAINGGDIRQASRLGARVAGLQALLKILTPPPPPRATYLSITLQ